MKRKIFTMEITFLWMKSYLLLFFRAFKNVFNAIGVNVETELLRFALNFQIQFQRELKCCEFIHRNVLFFSLLPLCNNFF